MKTYLCIGAGPGIGLAAARRFGREGYRVVLVSRSIADRQRLLAGFAAEGVDARFEAADAGDPAQISALIDRLREENLAVVHYNAAAMRYDASGNLLASSIDTQSPQDIAADIATDVTAPLVVLSTLVPAMTARGEGTILLTGGGFAVEPSADFLTLSVGKAAIRSMTQALFEPLRARGVHIATVRVSTVVATDASHPDRIAAAFWALHAQPAGTWTWETVYPHPDG